MANKPHAYEHFIDKAIKHPGYLRRATHTPAGKDIPESKIKADEHSKDEHLADAARLAERLKHMHHGK
jgi:hypothetical protein